MADAGVCTQIKAWNVLKGSEVYSALKIICREESCCFCIRFANISNLFSKVSN